MLSRLRSRVESVLKGLAERTAGVGPKVDHLPGYLKIMFRDAASSGKVLSAL